MERHDADDADAPCGAAEFTVAALTGARISELCGLTWADVRIDDIDDAEIEFGWQVDRHGNRGPTKTDGSART